MDYKINDLGGLKRQLEVTATMEDEIVSKKFEDAYLNFQKTAVVPGFRKGKTPMEIIKKRYGEDIENELVPELVSDIVKEIFEKDKLSVAGVVDYNLDSRSPGQPLHFFLTFEVVPQIEPKDYTGLKLERAIYRISPEVIEHEIYHILESNAEHAEVESLDGNNSGIATVDLQVIDENGLAILGQRRENYKIDLRSKAPELQEIRDRLLNAKVGDDFDIELETFDKMGQSAGKKKFRVFVKKLERLVLPDLSDEFAERVTGGKVKTVEDLKADIRRDLENYFEEKAEEELRDKIVQELLLRNDFEVPESMVDEYLTDLIEEMRKKSKNSEIDEELFRDQYRAAAVRAVKWNLLASSIIKREGLKIEDSAFEKIAEDDSKKYRLDKDMLLNFYKDSNDVKNKLLFNELFNFIINSAEIKVVEKIPEHKHEE
ncbi:MAG: trigger factor [Candidatus Kryptoniota bacterium]